MKISEMLERKIDRNHLLDTIKYFNKVSSYYPYYQFTIPFYRDNSELMDDTISELVKNENLEYLKDELNRYQFDKLIKEDELLTKAINLIVIREDKKVLNQLIEEYNELHKNDFAYKTLLEVELNQE